MRTHIHMNAWWKPELKITLNQNVQWKCNSSIFKGLHILCMFDVHVICALLIMVTTSTTACKTLICTIFILLLLCDDEMFTLFRTHTHTHTFLFIFMGVGDIQNNQQHKFYTRISTSWITAILQIFLVSGSHTAPI